MRHVTWLSRKLRDIEARKSDRLCIKYFVTFLNISASIFVVGDILGCATGGILADR